MNLNRSGLVAFAVVLMFACGGNMEDSASSGGAANDVSYGGTTAQSGGMSSNRVTTIAIYGFGGTLASTGGASSARQSLGGKTSTGGITGVGGAPLGGKSSTGGKTSTGGKSGVGGASSGGKSGTGGATGVGGVPLGGNTGTGGATTGGGSSWVPRTGGIPFTDGYFEMGAFHGALWHSSDSDTAARVDVEHSSCTYADDEMCVTGKAAKVPLMTGSTTSYDYSEVWGVFAGWNLNQALPGDSGVFGSPQGADFSDVVSMTINLEGAANLNMRVQLETRDSTGASTFYCATLPTSPMPQTIDFKTLRTSCWQSGGGIYFDPAAMKPTSLGLQVVTDRAREYPIDFCVTDLELNSELVGG